MQNMKVSTPTAQELCCKLNIRENAIHSENGVVDSACVLSYIKQNVVYSKRKKSTSYNTNMSIKMLPKDTCILRSYQKRVLDFIVDVKHKKLKSTMVIMPCGSGKTFTALCVVALTKCRTLIITNYKMVVQQWKRQLHCFFDIPCTMVQCISDKDFKFDPNDPPQVTIITYDTLTSIGPESRKLIVSLLLTEFTTIILDEAHKAVAVSYFCIISRLSGAFIAFTATPVREDAKIDLLKQLIRDEIEIHKEDLIRDGYLERVMCTTIVVPTNNSLCGRNMTKHQAIRAAVANPNKIECLLLLLREFIHQSQRVIVYCDDIWSINYVHTEMKRNDIDVIGPITMHMKRLQREDAVAAFVRHSDKVLLISRTGDEGIDIPSANKLIQICTPWGSRKQHAQRVGRVQRPFGDAKYHCEAITIVSEHTSEVSFSKRRDEYLREMGYAVHVCRMDIRANPGDINALILLIRNSKSSNRAVHNRRQTRVRKVSTFQKLKMSMG